MPLVFQKKGAPPAASGHPGVVIAIGSPHAQKPTAPDASMNDDEGSSDSDQPNITMCPKCGCQFDPATGAIVGGDYSNDQSGQQDDSSSASAGASDDKSNS